MLSYHALVQHVACYHTMLSLAGPFRAGRRPTADALAETTASPSHHEHHDSGGGGVPAGVRHLPLRGTIDGLHFPCNQVALCNKSRRT